MLHRSLRFRLFGCVLFACRCTFGEETRLNQVQAIGTHNSYHVAPAPAVMRLIQQARPRDAVAIDYTHRTIPQQLSQLRARQIELDVFPDPDGGLYANPLGEQYPTEGSPPHDPLGLLKKPGLKVLHFPNFDYRTRALTFVQALREVRQWSAANPKHCPLLVLVELKQSAVGRNQSGPEEALRNACDTIDREVLSVFRQDHLITPDSVRRGSPTLRDAIRDLGWPRLDDVRGKVMFALDNQRAARGAYLAGHPSLRGRVLFVSVDASHPAAAFCKINDPVRGFEEIKQAVRAGLIVRTRADADTRQARQNDSSRLEKALASGAHYISTDYPEPDPRFSAYTARLPDGMTVRGNPVSGPAAAVSQELDPSSANTGSSL